MHINLNLVHIYKIPYDIMIRQYKKSCSTNLYLIYFINTRTKIFSVNDVVVVVDVDGTDQPNNDSVQELTNHQHNKRSNKTPNSNTKNTNK